MANKLFPVVMRGYDKEQVDDLFARIDEALAGGDAAAKAAIHEEVVKTVFIIKMRGYPPTDVAMAIEQRMAALSA